jgi:hypothetical protein
MLQLKIWANFPLSKSVGPTINVKIRVAEQWQTTDMDLGRLPVMHNLPDIHKIVIGNGRYTKWEKYFQISPEIKTHLSYMYM